MNWKWLRSFFCQAASFALLVALAGQALAPAAQAQQDVHGQEPCSKPPRKRIPPIRRRSLPHS